MAERQENLYDYGRLPNQKNGPSVDWGPFD